MSLIVSGKLKGDNMTFKEILRKDVHDIFMNTDEFSEIHIVNGVKMPVQIDSNEQIEREKRVQSHMDGMYKKQLLIYVSALDYGPLPGIGKPVTIDGAKFIVTDSINEGGIYSLHLEANKS